MSGRRATALAIAYSPAARKQSALGTALLASLLTAAMPVTSRNYPEVAENIEEIFDCTGEEVVDEIVTRRIARLAIEFQVSPLFLAWLTAFGFGIAQAPTGGPAADEVQTLTIDATGGTFIATVPAYDGLAGGPTSAIAWNATAAQLRAALERIVGSGNVAVTKAGNVFTITFRNSLGSFIMPAITTNAGGLTGGAQTAVVATTTPGAQRTADISRLAAGVYDVPLTTLMVGFRNSNRAPVEFRDVAVGDFEVTWRAGEIVTGRATLVGSADLLQTPGFTMPDCDTVRAIRASDTRVTLGSTVYRNKGGSFNYSNELLMEDHAHTTDGLDIDRLERGDVRRQTTSTLVPGEPGDDLYESAAARETLAWALRVGPAGNNVTYANPTARMTFDGGQRIGFEGQGRESVIRLRPLLYKVQGNSLTPVYATANVDQSATMLSI